jgi:hypothetical protein
MRSRLGLLILACYLTFTMLACTAKPPANDAGNSATTTDSNNPAGSDNSGNPSSSASSKRGGNSGGGGGDAAAPQPIVIPAGTVLTVRLGETLSSKQSEAGQTFSATLAGPVEVDGKTVIPSGATAAGTVVAAHAAGKFKGASLLQIKLNSITVEGRQHAIETSSVARSEKGKGKRSAAMIGGGAGAGALIGALAGGGKGAAIGALVGGGAGTAGAAYSGNRDVTLPAEFAVSFKLEAPLQIER